MFLPICIYILLLNAFGFSTPGYVPHKYSGNVHYNCDELKVSILCFF